MLFLLLKLADVKKRLTFAAPITTRLAVLLKSVLSAWKREVKKLLNFFQTCFVIQI
jgi:hypothetical protein